VSLLAANEGQKCFLAGALLKIPEGRMIRADRLTRDSIVCAADGEKLRVESVDVHGESEQELVDLRTSNASLMVTASHRVRVQKGTQWQTQPAGTLAAGDDVAVGGGCAEALVEVRRLRAHVSVVAVVLRPDHPVEAFHPPGGTILSHGHGWCRTRRGQSRRPNNAGTFSTLGTDEGTFSIPGTDESHIYQRR